MRKTEQNKRKIKEKLGENKGRHIKKTERLEIEILLSKEYSIRSIAGVLKRSPSSISTEIRINSVNRVYDALKANHKAYVRRKYSKYQGMKINQNRDLERYVIKGLEDDFNPDEISGRMKKENQPFYISKTAIYGWLYSVYGQKYCKYLLSQRYKKKKRKKKTKKEMIPNRTGIEMRPLSINNRLFGGDLEGDTVVSGKKTKSKYALAVVIDRKFRYTKIERINNLKPSSFNQAILRFKNEIVINSLTLDNGIENKHWEKLDINTFFCDPYSSWQKGSVENVNKMIRRYIPKGADISKYSKKFIKKIETILNNKPRKILNYKTPLEAMLENNLLLNRNKKTLNSCIECSV